MRDRQVKGEDSYLLDINEPTEQNLSDEDCNEESEPFLRKTFPDPFACRRLVYKPEKQSQVMINYGHDQNQVDVWINPKLTRSLKEHQIRGVQFLWRSIVQANQHGCVLSQAMGLGKTFQVITFLYTLFREVKRGNNDIPRNLHSLKVLILCPPTLVDNWEAEFTKWLKDVDAPDSKAIASVQKLPSRLDQKHRAICEWAKQGEILIMSYQSFRELVIRDERDRLGTRLENTRQILTQAPSLVTADESHILKNEKTKIAVAMKKIQTQNRICLTGYPLQNRLEEYWTMINFVAQNYLGPLFEFRHQYILPITEGLFPESTMAEKQISASRLASLRDHIGPAVQRESNTVLEKDLPKRHQVVIVSRLTNIQMNMYKSFLAWCKNGSTMRPSILIRAHMLLRICDHPAVVKQFEYELGVEMENQNDNVADLENVTEEATKLSRTWTDLSQFLSRPDIENISHSNKIRILMTILAFSKKDGDKVLVFSRSIPMLNFIENAIASKPGPKIRYLRLDGNVPLSQRQHIIDLFNKMEEYDALLISSWVGSLGNNLTAANRVVICDVGWNPSVDEQAIARVYRYGQKKEVYVYRLITADTFEERLFRYNIHKIALFARVVDHRNPRNHFTREEMSQFMKEPRNNQKPHIPERLYNDEILNLCIGRNPYTIVDVLDPSCYMVEDEEYLAVKEEMKI
ncbi:hypothetical protein K7432_015296 [Basidiobolus ranarum]|uniref:Uncharacterized protein n=1 Tax=Basidiobolus ranarum TaxID=34480 RepID=A0ABR2VNG6_9FUNG